MNKYRDNYSGARLLHDKYRVLAPRGDYYNIPIFQRRKLRHRGGHWVIRNRARIQMQAVGLW